ncbi:MAG: SDR family oxidoreductase [Cyanobacteria bacterium J06573_11]
MHLSNKVALVTSSQRPRCAHTARQLAQAGASVMICGRNATQGRATVAEIQRLGGRASFILADISVLSDIQAAIDETIATYGRLDLLFNHAGSFSACDKPLTDITENTWDRMMEVTLKGLFFISQYALPFLQQSGNGSIITLIEHEEPVQNYAISRICQGGLVGLTQAIAQQFPNHSIVANLIVSQSHAPVVSALSTEHVLYHPAPLPLAAESTVSATAFSGVDDAISYLVGCENQLQGYTLVVHYSETE